MVMKLYVDRLNRRESDVRELICADARLCARASQQLLCPP